MGPNVQLCGSFTPFLPAPAGIAFVSCREEESSQKTHWVSVQCSPVAVQTREAPMICTVNTPYGPGIVDSFTTLDTGKKMYNVTLPWGTVYLLQEALEDVSDSHAPTSQAEAPKPSDPASTVKPVVFTSSRAANADAKSTAPVLNRNVFYGGTQDYVLFRLHQILHQRLSEARRLCQIQDKRGRRIAHPVDRLLNKKSGPGEKQEEAKEAEQQEVDGYQEYLTVLHARLDDSMDSTR